jgi:hypothetical protein
MSASTSALPADAARQKIERNMGLDDLEAVTQFESKGWAFHFAPNDLSAYNAERGHETPGCKSISEVLDYVRAFDEDASAEQQRGGVNLLVQDQQIDPLLLRIDGGTQQRIGDLDQKLVEEYSDAMKAGAKFPKVIAFHDGEFYWLADGFYRRAAAIRAGIFLDVDAREGTQRDAVLYSVGANAAHGLRRTNADKHRAVETLLKDEEWSKWSNREIGRQCGVSHEFVATVREEVSGSRSQMEATVKRGDSTYTVATENIGRHQASPDTSPDAVSSVDTTHLFNEQSPQGQVPAPATDENKQGQTEPVAGDGLSHTANAHKVQSPDRAAVESHRTSPPASVNANVKEVEAADDPEGWSELALAINISVKPGKSAKRGITISGRAGEGTPVFRTDFTATDLEPMPPALAALISDMRSDFAKKSSKVAAARSAAKTKTEAADSKAKKTTRAKTKRSPASAPAK